MPTPQSSTARMPRHQRRAQLIDVALDVFANHGFAQTTMEEIARQAAVSKPVLYQHFDNKQDLYFTLLDLQYETLRERVTTRMQAVDSAAHDADEQTAYQAVYGVFEFTSEPRGLYRLILDTSMEDSQELETRREQFLTELVDFISPYLQRHSSLLDETSSKFLTGGIITVVLNLACRWAEDYREEDSDHGQESIVLKTAVEHTYRLVAHGVLGFDRTNNPSA